ncbi:MAG TPA: N-acetylmuramoyl-L-alanine amidase [Kofleriaceae bacterium]|nr:N-acetylmuramoyl-L-alanine amidase [Kofleriaceae bacterium]
MKGNRALFAAMAALCLIPSCTSDSPDEVDSPVDSPSLDDKFAEAARIYDVPVDLLKAIAYVETGWQNVAGEDDELGRVAGAGVFGLWGDNLERGAAAAQLAVDDVRTDYDANILAAAARLSELAAQHGISGSDLMAWQPVIADFAQNPDDEARAEYVNGVISVLSGGASSVAEDGTTIATISPHVEIGMPEITTLAAGGDYANAIFRSSPNYNSRNGYHVSLVVIHSCEGNYAGCWGWLRNTAAQASAHYVVSENGGEVTQLVREANRAWHVAASYNCHYAGDQQCNLQGVSTNNFSVGIEHAGFASQASWSNGIIETSARLTCDITKRQGVIRDRNHIVSHGQLQPYNRTDPGPHWPWSHYIDRVRQICGDGGGGGGGGGGGAGIIIDSNNANNNQQVAKIELAGAWTASSSTAGYYGSGYYFANTSATSAPATFWFYLPAAGSKTIDAWWTAGTNRASAAPWIAYNAAGTEVGRASTNQRTNGSKWVALGTWNFSAGWNKVVLSRWTTSGDVVIADAVRVR